MIQLKLCLALLIVIQVLFACPRWRLVQENGILRLFLLAGALLIRILGVMPHDLFDVHQPFSIKQLTHNLLCVHLALGFLWFRSQFAFPCPLDDLVFDLFQQTSVFLS